VSGDAKRLASALSAAGLSSRQVAAEVLMYLPDGFVAAYERLWHEAYGTDAIRAAENPRVGVVKDQPPRTSSGTASRIGGVGAGHKKASARTRSTLHSEHALTTKHRVDRKLRALARDIQQSFTVDEHTSDTLPRRCAGRCKRWADPEWNYCPNCGGPTETIDCKQGG
jgi:hypothetical protein